MPTTSRTVTVLFTDGTVGEMPAHDVPPNLPELADVVADALGVTERPSTMIRPPLPAPGYAFTVYDAHVADVRVLTALHTVEPDIVILHTGPGPEDLPDVAMLKQALPRARLWLQTPGNYLAGASPERAHDLGAQLARATVALGGEVLSVNGEAPGRPGGLGWNFTTEAERDARVATCNALLAGIVSAAPALVVAWSSHDCLAWHRLVWDAIYGAASPVGLALHQHYPDTPGVAEGYKVCLARFRTSQQQCAAANIRTDLIPGGAGAVAYTQLHGLAPDGACAIYDRAQFAAGWASPKECDDVGLRAARADVLLRRAVGHEPGRVMRFQRARGLTPDGIVGRSVLGALGIAS